MSEEAHDPGKALDARPAASTAATAAPMAAPLAAPISPPAAAPAPSPAVAAPPAPSRRDFLGLAIGGTGCALAAALGYPVVRFIQPTAGAAAGPTEAGRVDEFPRASARIVLVGERPVIVIHTPDGEFRAFSALCTHLRCVVGYSSVRNRIECACHRGVYSLEGENVSGPPPRPLQAVRVDVHDGIVVLSEG